MDTFLTIRQNSQGLYKEKGSRFIALAYPLSSLEQVKQIVQDLHKEYHDARHICYAYILGAEGNEFRANDDGEPSGTAGKPIHGVLLSNKLTNVLIVVVRYFGGVKLGTSGLIAAYREAAADAIVNAEIMEKYVCFTCEINFQYTVMNDVMRIVKQAECEIINQNFENDCHMMLAVRKNKWEEMHSALSKIETVLLMKIVEK